jgi:hypothetical protein
VTIVEYASLTCPHCAAFHAIPCRKERYIDQGTVKLVPRFPLDGLALRRHTTIARPGTVRRNGTCSRAGSNGPPPGPLGALAAIARGPA